MFASELGEVQTAVALLAMIRAEGVPSPMRFKNSVHNAASGTASIAWENRAFSTSLCAGDDLVAMALLEAMALLDAQGGDVVVSLAEEDVPMPLPRHGEYLPVGFGFHLTAAPRPGALRLAGVDDEDGVSRPAGRDQPADDGRGHVAATDEGDRRGGKCLRHGGQCRGGPRNGP